MAMLAEPRRKQKWSLNPRGKQWSEDSNKFGQKMLEKMGWTDGKGLGANEQGMTEHVRLAFKNDTAGIGFNKDNMDKAWTEHQDGFNHFLQQLQKSQGSQVIEKAENVTDGLSGKSLEAKSKQSRARVHYQKFTRGKDVNKYSSKDLANIFGQKDLNVLVNVKKGEKTCVDDPIPIGLQDKRGGVITINSGSMADYFKNKNVKFQKTQENKINETAVESESEPEHVGFGFVSPNTNNQSENESPVKALQNGGNYVFDNPCLGMDSPKNDSTLKDCPKVSKKRKTEFVFENNGLDLDSPKAPKNSKKLKADVGTQQVPEEGFVNVALNLDSGPSENCNGKEFEVSRAQFGLANCALDITDEISDKKRVRFNDHVEYNTDSKKKKKAKARLDKFEVENKKHKKKRKHQDISTAVTEGFINKALDVEEVSDEVNDNQVNERKSKKAKRRKECRPSNLETILETLEEDRECGQSTMESENGTIKGGELQTSEDNPNANSNEIWEISMKKKKKKKKKENDANGELDIAIEWQDSENKIKIDEEKEGAEVDPPVEKKKKKKKKHKKDADFAEEDLRNANESEIAEGEENIDMREVNLLHTSEAKKLKKRKQSCQNDECTNRDLDVSLQEEKEVSDKENTSKEPDTSASKKPKKHKKHKKSEQAALDNDHSLNDTIMNSSETPADATTDKPFKETSPNNVNGKRHNTFPAVRSPWNVRARMSKKMLKALFHRNSISQFPGSNIHEMKGYGVDVE